MIHLFKKKLLYNHNGKECWTIVDFLVEGDKNIVVFTQLDEYKGCSITNSVESAIKEFCLCQEIEIENSTFIERYEYKSNILDLIILEGNKPIWKRLDDLKTLDVLDAIDFGEDQGLSEFWKGKQ